MAKIEGKKKIRQGPETIIKQTFNLGSSKNQMIKSISFHFLVLNFNIYNYFIEMCYLACTVSIH